VERLKPAPPMPSAARRPGIVLTVRVNTSVSGKANPRQHPVGNGGNKLFRISWPSARSQRITLEWIINGALVTSRAWLFGGGYCSDEISRCPSNFRT
jgi:hypothetical protein